MKTYRVKGVVSIDYIFDIEIDARTLRSARNKVMNEIKLEAKLGLVQDYHKLNAIQVCCDTPKEIK